MQPKLQSAQRQTTAQALRSAVNVTHLLTPAQEITLAQVISSASNPTMKQWKNTKYKKTLRSGP
jgi:hypothetical protein